MNGRFATLERVCAQAVAAGVVPGAVVLIADEEQARFHAAFGARQVEPGESLPATLETVYDLASVTKAVVTSVLTMAAVGAGNLRLDDPASRHLPEFQGPGKEAVTLRHLLAHAAGLPAHRPFYEQAPPGPGRRAAVLLCAARETLVGPPGARAVYSDIGFILLGWILERISGARLDVQADRAIIEPLGLGSTTFVDLSAVDGPARLLARAPVAATERCPARGRVLLGEVDDLNAFAMAGVAGHAGLFARAADLGRIAAGLCAAWRGEGPPRVAGGPPKFLERDVVREFWRPSGVSGSTWRLGWDGPAAHGSQAGSRLSRGAVGHLGFTGCSLWIDPERARWIVLLSNRVHPVARDDPRFRAFRTAVHDAAVEALP
jgi:CubicO group peptidase (beta-lactamase class C family)